MSEICEIGEQGTSVAGFEIASMQLVPQNLSEAVTDSLAIMTNSFTRKQRVLRCDYRALMESSYLVDPASSHMLVSKIKPCMSKYKQIYTVKLRMAH